MKSLSTPGYLAIAVCFLASGCALHKVREERATPEVSALPSYQEYHASQGAAIPEDGRWWESFGDPVLNELIDKGLNSSFDLQAFAARIEQASALAHQAGARLFPTLDVTARDEYEWDGEIVAPARRDREETVRLGALLGWEIDFFGRLSSSKRARALQEQATFQDWMDARLLLSSAIADRYFDIKEQRRQLEVIRAQIDINESLLKLTRLRFGQGQSSVVAVLQQREQLDETKARVPEVEARIGQLQYSLDALLGQIPGTGSEILNSSLRELPPLPDVGIPAALLQRRADLKAAQLRVLAIDHDVGVALAEQLPSIRIGGGVDWRGDPELGDAIKSAFGSLAAPLFAAGERRAEVRRQKARLEEAMADYTDRFLAALVEVESALLLGRKLEERQVLVEKQLDTARLLLEESRDRFSQGLTDYLPVFTSLNIVQVLERDVVSSQKDTLSSRIALHRALGGSVLDQDSSTIVTSLNE